MDRFVRALVSDIRLQVELRGPRDFHEAAVFAERADSVISRTPGQDSRKNWQQKQYKSPPQQRPPPPMKTSAESSGTRNTGPEPMELGTAHRCTLTKEEYQELRSKNACFYCRKANAGHFPRDYPMKKKRPGNGGSH